MTLTLKTEAVKKNCQLNKKWSLKITKHQLHLIADMSFRHLSRDVLKLR